VAHFIREIFEAELKKSDLRSRMRSGKWSRQIVDIQKQNIIIEPIAVLIKLQRAPNKT
jgi:hypothetical protein